jgi:hypothetical protein
MQGKAALLLVALLLSGCHAAETRRLLYGPDPVARGPGTSLRSVTVSSVQRTTFTDFSHLSVMLRRGEEAGQRGTPSPLADSAATGAALGAAAGVIAGVTVSAIFCSNPMLAGACPSVASVALQGAAWSAGNAGLGTLARDPYAGILPQVPSPGGFEKARDSAADALRAIDLQIALRNAVGLQVGALLATTFSASTGPDTQQPGDQLKYTTVAAQGQDAVLELNMVRASLSRPDLLGYMTLDLRARARLQSTANETILYQDSFSWSSASHTAVQWTDHDAAALREALLSGLEYLGRQIAMGAFAPERFAR